MEFPRVRAWRSLLRRPALVLGALALVLTLGLAACSDDDEKDAGGDASPGNGATDGPKLSGSINGDGSSTVFPITEAVAEEFGKIHDVDVTVGISGTGGGFEKFCTGETDFSDASRPIKDEEAQTCADNGIEYVEFEVAYDGLSVVVNPGLDFVDCLTVAELNAIWAPESTINNWSQVRDGFPDQELTLYGAGTDSGTFDYFTDEINGEEGASRSDYTASEDDNVIVQGVAGDDNAMGYFGFAYYVENKDKLGLVAVDGGEGCVAPSQETIESGEYSPLSRPIFVYVRTDALERDEVAEFMRFYMTEGPDLAVEVGYVKSPQASYDAGLAKIP